jgi:hypothetical protein
MSTNKKSGREKGVAEPDAPDLSTCRARGSTTWRSWMPCSAFNDA